jgi:hypothetical protein
MEESKTVVVDKLGLPMPYMAGGALRDILRGATAKDYDVFLNMDSVEEADRAIDELTLYARLNDKDFKVGGEDANEGYGTLSQESEEGENFKGLWGVLNSGSIQYIIGVWPKTEDPTERFDLSSTRCWLNYETGDITYYPDFLKSMQDRHIIAYNNSDYTKRRLNTQTVKMFGAGHYRISQFGQDPLEAYKQAQELRGTYDELMRVLAEED